MKKLFLIVILMCLTLNMLAQYELYKCVSTSSRYKNDSGNWSSWIYNDVNMILRLDTDDQKLEFNNKANTVFYFIETLSEDSGIDEDGDKYSVKRWYGYDHNGNKCRLISIDYPNLKNRNFILEYSDIEVRFETTIINTPSSNTSVI